MELEFKRFQEKDFRAYALWFVDPEQDRWLGPMDQEWLEAVLSEKESEGATWAVFRAGMLVAVAEMAFDSEGNRAAVTALATRPGLRRQGIGTAVLEKLLDMHRREGILKHVAFVYEDNRTAQQCLKRVGFVSVTPEPNENGYLTFQCGRCMNESLRY